MIRKTFRRVSFERFAIALTGFSTAFLYILVALDYSGTGSAVAAPAGAAGTAPVPAQIAARPPAAETPVVKPVQVFSVASNEKIADVFRRIGYHLDGVRERGEVPRVFFASLPGELATMRVAAKRKALFIQTALPLILHVNELILHDRARIEHLRDVMAAGEPVAAADRAWLQTKIRDYGLEKLDFDLLLRRVDAIPVSLALAQSAEESGWGTSRFAQEGNALFGQRVWMPHEKGMVPEGRSEGESFRVRAFDHLIDGVKSYARNLNVHRAYKDFRQARAALREDGAGVDGYSLAETLHRYSERGLDYVANLRAIIRVNRLKFFDSVRLGDRITLLDLGVSHGPPDA